MNSVTTHQPDTLPDKPPSFPAFSGALTAFLDPGRYTGADPAAPAFTLARKPPTVHMQAEAQVALAGIARHMQPASVATVTQWLIPLVAAVANPIPREEMPAKARAVALACEDLPGWVFTSDAQRQAVQTMKFWPSAAEVRKLVEAAAKTTLDTIEGLQRCVSYQRPAEHRPGLAPIAAAIETPEERAAAEAHVRAASASIRSELTTEPERAGPALRPSVPLSRAVLNEAYRRAGLTPPGAAQ